MNRIHILTRALELIESESAIVDATALASRLSYSRSHLDRMFLETIGKAPTALIRDSRMRQAAFEISSSRRAIIDIAFDCGFGSQEAFTRAFRRLYGRTPDEYRRIATPSPLHMTLSLQPHEHVRSRVRLVQVWQPR